MKRIDINEIINLPYDEFKLKKIEFWEKNPKEAKSLITFMNKLPEFNDIYNLHKKIAIYDPNIPHDIISRSFKEILNEINKIVDEIGGSKVFNKMYDFALNLQEWHYIFPESEDINYVRLINVFVENYNSVINSIKFYSKVIGDSRLKDEYGRLSFPNPLFNRYPLLQSWRKEHDELVRQFLILKEKYILSFNTLISNTNKPLVISENPYVDVICLFRFWELHKYIITVGQPNRRIRANFKIGKNDQIDDFNNNSLKKIRWTMKELGQLDDNHDKHEKIKFFERILLKNP